MDELKIKPTTKTQRVEPYKRNKKELLKKDLNEQSVILQEYLQLIKDENPSSKPDTNTQLLNKQADILKTVLEVMEGNDTSSSSDTTTTDDECDIEVTQVNINI